MPLVVETGEGLAGADSYNSLVELDAHATAFGYSAFLGLDDTAKEVAARKAATYQDGVYEGRLNGSRKTPGQARAVPRFGWTDRDGNVIDSDGVPRDWKQCHAELTVLATTEVLAPDLKRGGGVKRTKVGPIEKEYQDTAPGNTARPRIAQLLARLLRPSGVWVYD